MIVRIYIILSIIVSGLSTEGFTQLKYDHNWYIGYGYNLQDPLIDLAHFDFNYDSLAVEIDTGALKFSGQNITMSDESGELLFYSNGCEIRDENHDLIEGSNPLSPGFTYEFYCEEGSLGVTHSQSILCLPFHNEDTTDYFLYQEKYFRKEMEPFDRIVGELREHKLREINDSLFLEEKEIEITDNLQYTGALTAIKHLNNKDWWVVHPVFLDSIIEAIPITNKGAISVDSNVISPYAPPFGNSGQSSCQFIAAPDGEHIAYFGQYNQFYY